MHEIYNSIIDITIQNLEKFLDENYLKNSRYNFIEELKFRWETRLNFIFKTLDSSWIKFQEYSNVGSNNFLIENSVVKNLPFLSFPLICTLSGEFFKQSHSCKQKISGFKSWIWNCLVSHIISEGVYPLQSVEAKIFLIDKTKPFLINFKTDLSIKSKYNYYKKYKHLAKKGFNKKNRRKFLSSINGSEELSLHSQSKDLFIKTSVQDESEIDLEIDSQISDEKEENERNNFMIANVEKVCRKSSKWRIFLKEGILHVDGKDLLYNSCKCEFSW